MASSSHMPPVLSYVNNKLRESNMGSRPGTAGVAAPRRPNTAASTASRRSYARPTTAESADLFRRRTRKGKAFLRDNDAAESLLPQPLPEGIPVVASYTTFDYLIERKILAQPAETQVHLSTDDVRIMYEAKCLDQNLKPTWEREVRFMELLSANCRGTTFSLKENGLGSMCAEAISHCLANNDTYAILDLGGNRLRDQGAASIALLLETNTSIVHLSLKSNDVGHVGGEAIAESLSMNNTLTSLDLGGISGINRNHLGSKGAEALGRMLSTNEVLAFLNVSSNGLGADGLSLLANGLENNGTLTNLDLSSNNLSQEGCKQLASVIESTAIETLSLQRNSIGDVGCKDLFEATVKSTEAASETISRLYLEDNGIGELGTHYLSQFVQNSYKLTVLKLNDNPLGAGAHELADAIKDNKNLVELSLSNCQLRSPEASAIAAALAGNHSLTDLNLSKNRIYCAGVKPIADALRRNHTLQNLSLFGCACGLEGAQALAVMLRENSTIKDLNLKQNLIDSEAGDALEEALRVNTTLQRIDLAYNNINFRVIRGIQNALKRNLAKWNQQQVPRLEERITALDEDQKELYRVQEEIDLERRAAKEKGDDLLRRKEANRSHTERFRLDLESVREEEADMLARYMQMETLFRQDDEQMNHAREQCDLQISSMNSKINSEKATRENIERDIAVLRKKLKQVQDAEEGHLRDLRTEFSKVDKERQADMADAKWQSENLASNELKIKQYEAALGLSTIATAKAPPSPAKDKKGSKKR